MYRLQPRRERLFPQKLHRFPASAGAVELPGLRSIYLAAPLSRIVPFPCARSALLGVCLHHPGRECFNRIIETGVLHEVGLRNTLEPDPDNTGVGSFRSRTAFFLEPQREFSCFIQFGNKGKPCLKLHPQKPPANPFNIQPVSKPHGVSGGYSAFAWAQC